MEFSDTDCSAVGTDFVVVVMFAAKSVRSGCENVGENYTGVCPTSESVRWTSIQILTSLAARSGTFLGTGWFGVERGAIFELLMSSGSVEKMPNRTKPTYFARKHLFQPGKPAGRPGATLTQALIINFTFLHT